MFPAAREVDPITHDLLAPAGWIGLPIGGPCPMGPVMIEFLSAAHIACMVTCTGAITGGIVHPPPPAPPPVIGGSATVRSHGLPASRWTPSGDAGGCGVFLGDLKLSVKRTTLIGAPSLTVKVTGTATAADAVLVVRELDRLPPYLLELIANNHFHIVVCWGSVTSYRTDLRGVHPCGWPPGTTWDTVPGMRMWGTGEVVIAVIGHGTPAGPHVPVTGEGHGSSNLVIHETLHAVEMLQDQEEAGVQRMRSLMVREIAISVHFQLTNGRAPQQVSKRLTPKAPRVIMAAIRTTRHTIQTYITIGRLNRWGRARKRAETGLK